MYDTWKEKKIQKLTKKILNKTKINKRKSKTWILKTCNLPYLFETPTWTSPLTSSVVISLYLWIANTNIKTHQNLPATKKIVLIQDKFDIKSLTLTHLETNKIINLRALKNPCILLLLLPLPLRTNSTSSSVKNFKPLTTHHKRFLRSLYCANGSNAIKWNKA